MKLNEENTKMKTIFDYVLELALADADYGLKQFTRIVKGIFAKGSLCSGQVTCENVFTPIFLDNKLEGKKFLDHNLDQNSGNGQNDINLPHQDDKYGNKLGDLDSVYFGSLSEIFKIPAGSNMKLEIEQCTEDQQKAANEYLIRSSGGKEKQEVITKNKGPDSIGIFFILYL